MLAFGKFFTGTEIISLFARMLWHQTENSCVFDEVIQQIFAETLAEFSL